MCSIYRALGDSCGSPPRLLAWRKPSAIGVVTHHYRYRDDVSYQRFWTPERERRAYRVAPTLPDPLVREHTLAALMTLAQAGFIELLRGTLAVRPDGTIATGRTRGVPRVETLRLLLAGHTWHRDHGVRTRVALVLAPTLDGMRYAGLENALEA